VGIVGIAEWYQTGYTAAICKIGRGTSINKVAGTLVVGFLFSNGTGEHSDRSVKLITWF
jgi:hypothetical protein